MYYATVKEMERLDALAVENGLEIRQMMELAGWHMLSVFRELAIEKSAKIAVVVGKGNKGGDGLSAAHHLVNYGWNVEVLLLDKAISPDAQHYLELLEKMNVPVVMFAEHKDILRENDVIIDALIGYHLEGAPRGVFREAVEAMSSSGKKVIAYDLPSGVDPDTGACLKPCVQAFATLSLAMPKKLFATEQGRAKSGQAFVADIGIPGFLYDKIALNCRPDFAQEGLIPLTSLLAP
ncbi:MAG TPA: NAD(P)H-hydrate epimerase [Candidatus Paceibacterota bacterium]